MNDRRMNLLKEKKEELVSECKVSRLKSTHRKEDDSKKIQQFDDARKQAVFSKANEGGSVLLNQLKDCDVLTLICSLYIR